MLQLLHVHHGGEDRLLWPRLRQRAPEQLAPTVELMEHQHHGIDSIVQALDEPLDRWVASATAADRAMIAAGLADLHAALEEHLQSEERHVLPLAARLLTQAEWGELAEEVKTSRPEIYRSCSGCSCTKVTRRSSPPSSLRRPRCPDC
jgi:hemerythrin-like domain-containing protein